MDYHEFLHLLAHTPTAKLLRLRNAHTALLLSFLYQEFKMAGLATRAVLAPQLSDYLRELGYVPEVNELSDAAAEQSGL